MQQNPDDLPSVQAEQQHSGKARNRMVGLGVALIAGVVVTAVVVVNVSGGSEDSDRHVLTSRAVGDLREGLEDDGWRCYDMGDQPVATECYLWRARTSYDYFPTIRVLTMRYAGPDALAEVSLDAPLDGDPRDEVVADTAALIDRTLLSDLPGRHLRTLPTAHGIFQEVVDGIHVHKIRSGFVLQSERLPDTNQFEPEPFPPAQQTRAALQKQGHECEAEQGENGTQYIECVRDHQGLRISANGWLDGEDITHWSFNVHDPSSADSMRIDDAARALATTAHEAGLTDEEGAMFIQENPQTRQQGVFGGYHLEIGRASTVALDVTIRQTDP